MPFSFNAVEFCVVIINEKPWILAKEACSALECGKTTKAADVVRQLCNRENYAHKWQLTGSASEMKPVDWPKDSQKYNTYTNQKGMYKLVFERQKPEAKAFRKHCCNVLFPHVWQQLSHKSHSMEIEDLTACIQTLNPSTNHERKRTTD